MGNHLRRNAQRRLSHSTRDFDYGCWPSKLAPKPDVPPTIRKRPQPKAESASSTASHEAREEPKNDPPATHPAAPEKRPTVAPLSPASYLVKFTASAELRDKLERLEALIPDSDLASVIDAAVPKKWQAQGARRQVSARRIIRERMSKTPTRHRVCAASLLR